MVWFKIDDGFPTSKPVLRIPRRHRTSAIGLWTLAGAWSAKELTDGHIETHLIEEFGSTPAMARHLVTCGLWEASENGWNFRHWAKYQPTREQVMADRDREAERKRAYRASKRSPSGTTTGQTVGHQAESGHPDPTRPDPTRPLEPKGSSDTPDDGFDAFWDVYDKKDGRKGALAKWRLAIKKPGVTPELLIRSAGEYVGWLKSQGKHPQYTKNPTSWLNGEHWMDERAAPSRPPQQMSAAEQRMAANAALTMQLRAEQETQQRAIEGNA